MNTPNRFAILKLLLVAVCIAFAAMAWMDDVPARAGIMGGGSRVVHEGLADGSSTAGSLPMTEPEHLPGVEATATTNRTEQQPPVEVEIEKGCVTARVYVDWKLVRSAAVAMIRLDKDGIDPRTYLSRGEGSTAKESAAPDRPRAKRIVEFELESSDPESDDPEARGDGSGKLVTKRESVRSRSVPGNDWIAHYTRTDRHGEISMCVAPGKWLLEVEVADVGSLRLDLVIAEGEERDLGNLHVVRSSPLDPLSTSRRARKPPGAIHVHAGQPWLQIRTLVEGKRESTFKTKTGKLGDGRFTWQGEDPIRIDLVDKNGFILGSTDRFDVYPKGADVDLFIPSVPGTLLVHLPPGVQAVKGVSYQVHITRTDSPWNDFRIQSIFERRYPRNEKGYQTTPRSIEFPALRTGAYEVKAMRREWVEDTETYDAVGEWLRGHAYIFEGQVTHCALD